MRLNGDPSEDAFHAGVVQLFRLIFHNRPVVWTHFPAGGYRLEAAARARLARLGLQPGFPDLMVWWRGGCLGLELKTRKGTLSAAQKGVHAALLGVGVPVVVCRRDEDVLQALRDYRIPHKEVSLGQSYARPEAGGPTQSEAGATPPA